MSPDSPLPHQAGLPRSSRSSASAAGAPAGFNLTEEQATGYAAALRRFFYARQVFHSAQVEYSREQNRLIVVQTELIPAGLATTKESILERDLRADGETEGDESCTSSKPPSGTS